MLPPVCWQRYSQRKMSLPAEPADRAASPADSLAGAEPLACFHPVTAAWFRAVFDAPTAPQRMGWPVIARGESALILAPTGTGKTLAAFLWCLDRLMLQQGPATGSGIRRRDKRAAASFTFRR